ncbi:RHS repeat-associated core domain-containing protein [Massilia sp. CCM 9029]|uniref:RHS repeat-associated core domain-containing protein n=1 Tax=Massilia scottii TaxID=3057166 RepID=UPI00279669D0|nr:RHS repeat-associated core domain-containing protein [Massilia sp. CCM 9029]MDQ1835504.1 RHS repeat-associated core domain-containing protein [Massilia sp. CCM 9029]
MSTYLPAAVRQCDITHIFWEKYAYRVKLNQPKILNLNSQKYFLAEVLKQEQYGYTTGNIPQSADEGSLVASSPNSSLIQLISMKFKSMDRSTFHRSWAKKFLEIVFPDRSTSKRISASLPFLLFVAMSAHSQTATVRTEDAKLIRASRAMTVLGPDLFGDKVNIYNGALEFVQTDVSIPGNSKLPVAVGRRMVTGSEGFRRNGLFKNWDLEIPSIHGTFSNEKGWSRLDSHGQISLARCSNFGEPPVLQKPGTNVIFRPAEFWHGNMLYIPGAGDQEILKRNTAVNNNVPLDGADTPLVTRDGWAIRCLSTLSSTDANSSGLERGEGFLAISPDGSHYRFDWLVSRPLSVLSKSVPFSAATVSEPPPSSLIVNSETTENPEPNAGSGQSKFAIKRDEIYIFPTQITDRYGNVVKYTYDSTDKWKLLSIKSADGDGNAERSLIFSYYPDSHTVAAVTDGLRTWNYSYGGHGWGGPILSTVRLPDYSSWDLSGLDGAEYGTGLVNMYMDYGNSEEDASTECDAQPPGINSKIVSGSIVHPSGAIGVFTMSPVQHARNGVPKLCYSDGHNVGSRRYFPQYYDTYALTSKKILRRGSDQEWTTTYDTFNPGTVDCTTCAIPSKVSVTDPEYVVTRYTFGSTFGVDEGLLKQVDVGWDGNKAIKTTVTNYNQSFIQPVGFSDQDRGDGKVSARHIPQDKRTIHQQDVEFTWAVPSNSDFDAFARPLKVVRSSSLGMSIVEKMVYHDNKTKWVLGQLESLTEMGTGKIVIQNGYNPITANLETVKRFGNLADTYSYNLDGTLATSKDGKNQITSFGNYKRGLPRLTTYANKTSESRAVNDIGLITSITNAASYTTTYGYDIVGRLALITPPVDDSVQWTPTKISYEQLPFDGWSDMAEPGDWRQIEEVGDARKITYYDGLFHPLITQTYDQKDIEGTSRIVQRKFDSAGRMTFTSRPVRTLESASVGIDTYYDELGRKAFIREHSELGTLTSEYAYVSGFKTVFKNPRGISTTTNYQVFDLPSEDAIVGIQSAEGTMLSIGRDTFGKPTSITRSGGGKTATRNYVYDKFERRCKTVEPETGATVEEYDLVGNIVWRASGLVLPSTSACDTEKVAEINKIKFAHDSVNQLTSTVYGDGGASIMRTYTPDNLPLTISSNGTVWTNTYNKRRLKERENLIYGGVAYNIDRLYDANASLAQLTYPDGTAIAYAPNALGEPGKVGAFASEVKYHPNGAIASFTYGNGIKHTLAQNARGLPEKSVDAGVINDVYSYDENANVVNILDAQRSITNREMTYDDLDRLKSVKSPVHWGTASYTYDALDNLTTSTLLSGWTARTAIHNYDAVTNRLNGISSAVEKYNLAYKYDSRGNVIQRGSRVFVFDQANRLTSAPGRGSYIYDGLGHRVSVIGTDGLNEIQVYSQDGKMLYTRPTSVALGGGTKFIYLHNHVIAESSAAGNKYDHTDGLGSPVAWTDSKGAVLERTVYEPFGLTAAGAVPTLGYTGHMNAVNIGMVYMQQRYYDPVAGRMLSIDPVTTDANTGSSFNRYAYAANNPYKYIDPDGRNEERAYGAGVAMGAALTGMSKSDIAIWKGSEGREAVSGFESVHGIVVTIKSKILGTPASPVEKTASGKRVEDFTPKQISNAKTENAAANGGQMACTDCGKGVKSIANEKGVPTPPNQVQVHHDPAIHKGGTRETSQPVILCPSCHQTRHREEK